MRHKRTKAKSTKHPNSKQLQRPTTVQTRNAANMMQLQQNQGPGDWVGPGDANHPANTLPPSPGNNGTPGSAMPGALPAPGGGGDA